MRTTKSGVGDDDEDDDVDDDEFAVGECLLPIDSLLSSLSLSLSLSLFPSFILFFRIINCFVRIHQHLPFYLIVIFVGSYNRFRLTYTFKGFRLIMLTLLHTQLNHWRWEDSIELYACVCVCILEYYSISFVVSPLLDCCCLCPLIDFLSLSLPFTWRRRRIRIGSKLPFTSFDHLHDC